MDQILKYLPENTLVLIAVGLGVFFLFAAFVKGIRTRRHRQLRESSEQAAANGGTAEAPVHFGNPFTVVPPPTPESPVPETPAPPAQAPAVQQDVPAAPPTANEPADNPNAYVWE